MRQKRREYIDIPEAFNEIISKICNSKTGSDNTSMATTKKYILQLTLYKNCRIVSINI